MHYPRLTRNIRTLGYALGAAALAAGASLLWWANRTGLPESWRTGIEREIGRHGVHVQIGALTYIPLRGVTASQVRVFSDAARNQEISRVERVLLDFDRTKLARGVVHLNKIILRNAALSLPVNPDDPGSQSLVVTGAHATLLMPGGRRLEIRDGRGRIAGIDVSLNARLTGDRVKKDAGDGISATEKRRRMLTRTLKLLEPWRFDADNPPRLAVFLEGDLNDRSSVSARITLRADHLEKNQHRLEDLHAEARLDGQLLNFTTLKARDSRGTIDARLDYDFRERFGRFDVQSSLETAPLLGAWLERPAATRIVIGGGQEIVAEGGFHLDADNQTRLHMTGRAAAEEVMLRGVRFDAAESAFAWRDGDLFLRDLQLTRPDGTASGKAIIQWPLVRLALHSTLPAAVYKPLFAGQPLEKVISDFTNRPEASFDIRLEGGFDATEKTSWAYSGSGTVRNVNYRNVPVDMAQCNFAVSHRELDFTDGTVVFNYRDYPLRAAYNGPQQGSAKVGRIRYSGRDKTVEVGNVSGTVWAAPLVRLFAPAVADSLETYRFHQPPRLQGSGIVDITPAGRTALDVSFSTPHAADYQLMGADVTISQPSGKVSIRGPRVSVRDLQLTAFEGPVRARFDYLNGKLTGETSWTKLSMKSLSSSYGFQTKGGEVTGRIAFSIDRGRLPTMSGDGLFALEKTELFSVPMFGPLSPLISGVLNDRRSGFERAKNAFCTFEIRNGVLRTRDFQTTTTSLNFVGEGEVDLSARTLEMTMRMNARGLLGLITLPLRPFYGMFQFRGTGPLKEPVWENVMFTPPSDEQEQLLRAIPKATTVTPRN